MSQNQELFLTKEQVAELTEEQALKHIKKLEKAYPIDKPFAKMDNFMDIWVQVDDIANTLLYLEDHIDRCQMLERMAIAGSNRWINRDNNIEDDAV